MSTKLLTEYEFKTELCKWLLKNKRACVLCDDESLEDFVFSYRLPEFDYVHTQSAADVNGDLITMLKSSYVLRDWETKSGKKRAEFKFYLVLKTCTDTPNSEPFPIGYFIP